MGKFLIGAIVSLMLLGFGVPGLIVWLVLMAAAIVVGRRRRHLHSD